MRDETGADRSGTDPLDAKRVRRIADVLDRLDQRVESLEQRSALSQLTSDRTVTDLARRVDRAEGDVRLEAESIRSALAEVKDLNASLNERLARMETEPAAQRALRTLSTLEQRLDRLTQQQYDSEARAAAEALAVRSEIDRRAAAFASDLAALDGEFDAAMASLRSTVASFGGRLDEVSDGQQRLTEGLSGVAQAVDGLSTALDGVDQRERRSTEERRQAIQSLDGAVNRLDQAQTRLGAGFTQIGATLEALAERQRQGEEAAAHLLVQSKTLTTRQAEIAAALGDQDVKLQRRLRSLDEKTARLDDEQTDVREVLGRTTTGLGALTASVDEVFDRTRALEAENSAHAEALRDLARRQDAFGEDLDGRVTRGELDAFAASLGDLSQSKDRVASEVTGINNAVTSLAEVQSALAEGLEEARRAANAIAARQEGFQIALDSVEARAKRTAEDTRDSLIGLDSAVARLDDEHNRTAESLGGLALNIEALAERQRLADSAAAELAAQTLAAARRQDDLLAQVTRRDAEAERRFDALERAALRLDEDQAETRAAQERLASGLTGVAAAFDALQSRTQDLEAGAAAQADAIADAHSKTERLSVQVSAKADLSALEALSSSVQALNEARAAVEGDLSNVARATEALAARSQALESGAEAAQEEFRALRSETSAALADLEARLAAAREAEAVAIEDVRMQLAQASARAATRFDAHEARIAGLDGALAAEVERLGARADAAEQRLHVAERTQSDAMRALQAALAGLTERTEGRVSSAEAVERVLSLQAELDAKLAAARVEIERQLDARLTAARAQDEQRVTEALERARGEPAEESLAQINSRLSAAERRAAQTVEMVAAELRTLTAAFEGRLAALESSGARIDPETAPSGALADIASLERTLIERVQEGEARTSSRLSDALSHVGARIMEVDRRAQDAAEPIVAGLTSLAERLEALELRLRPQGQPDAPAFALAPEPQTEGPAHPFSPPSADEPLGGETPFADLKLWNNREGADEPLGGTLADELDDALDLEPGRGPLSFAEPLDSIDDHLLAETPLPPIPTAPEPKGKTDYLSMARRAALANGAQSARRKLVEAVNIGGRPRAVAAIAAGAAVAVAAGAYMGAQPDEEETAAATQRGLDTSGVTRAAAATSIAAALETQAQTASAASFEALEAAAKDGDPIAQYELGVRMSGSGAHAEAARLMRASADQGLAVAAYRLAKLYERGQGVERDLEEARRWTEQAATGGNRKAMHDLGVYFARGDGAKQDDAAAFRWFREAAAYGVVDSQFNLGVLYQQGRGAPEEPSEALFWFLVASAGGDADAVKRAEALAADLPAEVVTRIEARAERFRPKAASGRANGEFGQTPWTRAAAAEGGRQNVGG